MSPEQLEGLADDLRWLATHPEDDEHRRRVVRAPRVHGDACGGELGRLARQLARDELPRVQVARAAERLRELAAVAPLRDALHWPRPGTKSA